MNEKQGFFRRRKKLIIISAVVILIGIIILFNLQSQREKSIKVTVEKVEKHDLTSVVSASGEVKPKKNVDVSTQMTGVHRILKIGVEEGQQVKEGDFLLKLESTQYEASADRNRAAIRSLQADLIQADARLKKDERFYERQKKLYDEKLISGEQLEAAQAQYEISKAQYESIRFQIDQAEASLQSALDNLNKTTYYSPIDGIITSLRYEEGEIIILSTFTDPVLMTIADLSIMEVEVEVDETDVIAVTKEQAAEVRVDAFPNQTITGRVTEVGSSALPKMASAAEESKDFKVVITLDDPPQAMKPGLSASADIITAKKNDVLAVPISALVLREKEEDKEKKKSEQEEGVYVVEANRVKFQPVKKGIMGEMLIEILEGLEEGTEIVVGPYDSLRQLKDDTLIKAEKRQEQE